MLLLDLIINRWDNIQCKHTCMMYNFHLLVLLIQMQIYWQKITLNT